MYQIRNIEVLEKLSFLKYKAGYSKKMPVEDYKFIDCNFETRILKKVKFIESNFVYTDVSYEDLSSIVRRTLNLKQDDLKNFIEENFKEIGRNDK